MQRLLAVALLIPSLVSASRALRAREEPAAAGAVSEEELAKNIEDIHKKWDKMGDFLEAMFTIGCKWKNGKDVNGLVGEKLKNGDIKLGDVEKFKKETQGKNMDMLGQACGMIVAKGEKKCRQGCADSYGEAMEDRSKCDGECVANYGNFEKRCHAQGANLEKVYEMKIAQASARKRCYEGFCHEFPTVWLKEEADMAAEVTTRCGDYCAEDNLKRRCTMKWQMEVDFIKDKITSECHADGKAEDCMKDATTAASEAETSCQTDGKKTCGTQFDTCKTKGKTDATFKEAGDFCESRKGMCESQVTDNCLKEHKAALTEGKAKCESADGGALKECKSTKLKAKEDETVKKCTSDSKPTCEKDCEGKCLVPKMNECLGHLESEVDATEEFCKDFWTLIHESSEVDPVTGNPIVFLSGLTA